MQVLNHLYIPCCGGNESSEHSKHDVIFGIITRACPFKPSVPPSMRGIIVAGSGSPSLSYCTFKKDWIKVRFKHQGKRLDWPEFGLRCTSHLRLTMPTRTLFIHRLASILSNPETTI